MRLTFFAFSGRDRHGHRQVGLAGTGRADAEHHVVLLDGLDVFPLVDGARLHGALDARRALLSRVHQRTQSDRRVGHHQAQHPVQFPIVRIDALAAQRLEILKDALHPGHTVFRPLHVHGIGAKIDPDAKVSLPST